MQEIQNQDKNFKIFSDKGYTYDQFIKEILEKRGRFNCEENSYKERHHILPKSKGGNNSVENLIDLYGQEHFIAHKLLAKENPSDKQLTCAWWIMSHCSGKNCKDNYYNSYYRYLFHYATFLLFFFEVLSDIASTIVKVTIVSNALYAYAPAEKFFFVYELYT